MKIALNVILFVALCCLGAVAHANGNITVDKVYNGGFTEPDTFIVTDTNRGVTCYVFAGSNNITSNCFTEKDLKKPVDSQ